MTDDRKRTISEQERWLYEEVVRLGMSLAQDVVEARRVLNRMERSLAEIERVIRDCDISELVMQDGR